MGSARGAACRASLGPWTLGLPAWVCQPPTLPDKWDEREQRCLLIMAGLYDAWCMSCAALKMLAAQLLVCLIEGDCEDDAVTLNCRNHVAGTLSVGTMPSVCEQGVGVLGLAALEPCVSAQASVWRGGCVDELQERNARFHERQNW